MKQRPSTEDHLLMPRRGAFDALAQQHGVPVYLWQHTTVDKAPPAGFYKLMTHALPDLVEVRLVSRTESTTKR